MHPVLGIDVIIMTVLVIDYLALPRWLSKIHTLWFRSVLSLISWLGNLKSCFNPASSCDRKLHCCEEPHCWGKINSSQLVTVALCTERIFSPLELISCFQPYTVPSWCASNLDCWGMEAFFQHPFKEMVLQLDLVSWNRVSTGQDKDILGCWSGKRLRTVPSVKCWAARRRG